jgi:hypothetical protein
MDTWQKKRLNHPASGKAGIALLFTIFDFRLGLPGRGR